MGGNGKNEPANNKDAVTQDLKLKIANSNALLLQGKFKPVHAAEPVALYFRNLRSGGVRLIRVGLPECSTTWAMLGLDFVEVSVL